MIYLGTNENVRRAVAEYGKDVDRIYSGIFRGLYRRIESSERELLIPEAFDEAIKSGDVEVTMSPKEDDSLFLAALPSKSLERVRIGYDGRIICQKGAVIPTSCMIRITEAGARAHSGKNEKAPLYLALYAHEYGHFIEYALQEKPLQMACGIAARELNSLGISPSEAIALAKTLEEGDENSRNLVSFYAGALLALETLTNELEIRVLRRLGFDTGSLEEQHMFGDIAESLHEASDPQLVHGLVNWNNIRQPDDAFRQNFYSSLDNVRFRKMNIRDFRRSQK